MDNGKICQEVQQKYGKENIMPIMGQMSLTGGQMQAPVTAEERQLKNERKRVLACSNRAYGYAISNPISKTRKNCWTWS